ncbi:unnamed protein product [Chondrus crispus]|uniref:Uncharacterized protein n=1 Tax=Chondrus crispus TaxID=2769 RepID=R7QLA6_CHOCR|nr:unnamed protein product [Chondrus crispus]CDF39297.1 unnamed protein product [Chondrus crispus]|eukprot:XP_005719208.1 unnamed protein product [Chondrus crispus]
MVEFWSTSLYNCARTAKNESGVNMVVSYSTEALFGAESREAVLQTSL